MFGLNTYRLPYGKEWLLSYLVVAGGSRGRIHRRARKPRRSRNNAVETPRAKEHTETACVVDRPIPNDMASRSQSSVEGR